MTPPLPCGSSGAIRATNAEIFDAYLLKSLDGGLADGNAGVYAAGVVSTLFAPR